MNPKNIPVQVREVLEAMRKSTASLVLAGNIETALKMLDSIQDTMKNLGLEPADLGEPTIDGLTAAERVFVERGSVLEAIKSVRDRMGIGLKESKDLVDFFRSKNLVVNS